ncbi:hypothetical protein [Serratia sp. JSRIV006]|uniref:hypothetical protein n=1 Tax=Serratia sp. JSRIV006 TaxID=2831896 RepID=UPI001CBBF18B|nr:hypothetical protein [Serratia sp. JSRIV006]
MIEVFKALKAHIEEQQAGDGMIIPVATTEQLQEMLVVYGNQHPCYLAAKELLAVREAKNAPVQWGSPKTVRQLIQQLQTLDQDLETTALLRMPANFRDGKAVRQSPIDISYERLDGCWLVPYKGEGRKVLAFWAKADHREEGERGELLTIEAPGAGGIDMLRLLGHLIGVINTVNHSKQHEISIDGDPCYWQCKEWVEYLLEESKKAEEAYQAAALQPVNLPYALLQRLCDWDIRYPVNCSDGYAGLKALDAIIADARAMLEGKPDGK